MHKLTCGANIVQTGNKIEDFTLFTNRIYKETVYHAWKFVSDDKEFCEKYNAVFTDFENLGRDRKVQSMKEIIERKFPYKKYLYKDVEGYGVFWVGGGMGAKMIKTSCKTREDFREEYPDVWYDLFDI